MTQSDHKLYFDFLMQIITKKNHLIFFLVLKMLMFCCEGRHKVIFFLNLRGLHERTARATCLTSLV